VSRKQPKQPIDELPVASGRRLLRPANIETT
jgi:hypothetical protein